MATKVAKYDLKQLVRFIEKRHVAVPEFQRGFVWKTAQVKKLFDSLIKQYPVGSFILWETRQQIDARTLDGENLPARKFLILDGQQRMVSAYYLYRQQAFVQPHVKDKFHETCDSRERDVVDFEKFYIGKNEKGNPVLEYGRDSSCKFDVKKFQRLMTKGYRFPVVTITLDAYRKAIEVFERINQAGTRISTESIFLSETFNKYSNIGRILREWKRNNQNSLTRNIDTVIFIHVFALILQLENGNADKIEIRMAALKKIAEEVRNHQGSRYNRIFERVVVSVARAVQYLKEEYGIITLGDLPSQTMLTVLSAFFYYRPQPTTAVQAQELRKWFWRSSLDNRYIGSGYSENIGPDVLKMRKLALEKAGLNIPLVSSKVFAKLRGVDMRAGRSTYRNIVKQMLWQQGPVFVDGKPVNRGDVESGQHNPENDHFFPYKWNRRGHVGEDVDINNILNLHFLNGDENSRKKDRRPSMWLEERINELDASPKAVKTYFESQLLPFKNVRDLKKYERAFAMKRSAGRKEFARRYNRFLWKRFKLFEKVLIRLQNGHTR